MVVALTALAFAATIALLTRALLRWLEPIYALLFAVLAVSMTAGHVLARPHMLAMPLMMIWTIELVRASEANRAPGLWLLPLMTLWANLHGGFTLGIALALPSRWRPCSAARRRAALRQRAQVLGHFPRARAGLRAGHAAWRTRHSVHLAGDVRGQLCLERIGEWRSPNFHTLQPLELWLLGGLALVLHQGLRLPPVRLLLLLGLIHLR